MYTYTETHTHANTYVCVYVRMYVHTCIYIYSFPLYFLIGPEDLSIGPPVIFSSPSRTDTATYALDPEPLVLNPQTRGFL